MTIITFLCLFRELEVSIDWRQPSYHGPPATLRGSRCHPPQCFPDIGEPELPPTEDAAANNPLEKQIAALLAHIGDLQSKVDTHEEALKGQDTQPATRKSDASWEEWVKQQIRDEVLTQQQQQPEEVGQIDLETEYSDEMESGDSEEKDLLRAAVGATATPQPWMTPEIVADLTEASASSAEDGNRDWMVPEIVAEPEEEAAGDDAEEEVEVMVTHHIVSEDDDTDDDVESTVVTPEVIVLAAGSAVEARWKGSRAWYPGTIMEAHSDGTFKIDYADGDEDDGVPAAYVRAVGEESATDSDDVEQEPWQKMLSWLNQPQQTTGRQVSGTNPLLQLRHHLFGAGDEAQSQTDTPRYVRSSNPVLDRIFQHHFGSMFGNRGRGGDSGGVSPRIFHFSGI